MATATLPAATTTVADVLRKTALYVNHPVNASLSDALHTAVGDNTLAAATAAELLARTLRRHVRDLAWWDRSHSRAYVAGTLKIAAMAADTATAVTR